MLSIFFIFFYLESFSGHMHTEDPRTSLSVTSESIQPFKYYFVVYVMTVLPLQSLFISQDYNNVFIQYRLIISLYIIFDIALVLLFLSLHSTDATLKCELCTRALAQCTDIIVESNIDPIALSRKLYSKEVISENIYKKVKDKETRETTSERLDRILDDIKDHVKHNAGTFTTFLDILRDDSLNRNDLADKIMSKYKGMIHCFLILMNSINYFFFQNWLHQSVKNEFATFHITSKQPLHIV